MFVLITHFDVGQRDDGLCCLVEDCVFELFAAGYFDSHPRYCILTQTLLHGVYSHLQQAGPGALGYHLSLA